MTMLRVKHTVALAILLVVPGFVLSAAAQSSRVPLGGPSGLVENNREQPLEGMMVQLIAKKSGIRTTVFSQPDGHYEFPKLPSGDYVLRIARPMEYLPFWKEDVPISGATHLDDIVLNHVTLTTISPPTPQGVVAHHVSEPPLLPPSPFIASQLSGSEWLMSMPGTPTEKALISKNCTACHALQQIFRSRFDEAGWKVVLYRMLHGAGSPLINTNAKGRVSDAELDHLAKWFATVRGPGVPDEAFFEQPRPKGRSTHAIITEYELPRLEATPHDVSGDGKGNLWYSIHRASPFGVLDAATGKVKEYFTPKVEGGLPGTHWIYRAPDGIVWASENWVHQMLRLDPKTGNISTVPWPGKSKLNSAGTGNMAMDSDGYIWDCRDGAVHKIDPKTGKIVQQWPTKRFDSTYESGISDDGRYWGGGAFPRDGVVILDIKTGQMWEPITSPDSQPARGGFDRDNNFWMFGKAAGGPLVEFVMKTKTVREFIPPEPYGNGYSVTADKNNEIWGGDLQTGRFDRFNPKTAEWTEYLLPEPYSHDRKAWVDNSTDPVSVWYVEHEGYMVHIQPLD